MRQIIDVSTRNGKDRHSLDGAVVLDLAHQPSGKDLDVWPDEEHLTLYVRLRDQRCVRMSFWQVTQCKQLVETHDLVGSEFKLNTDDADGPTCYFVTGRDGRPLLRFLSGLWIWREFDQDDILLHAEVRADFGRTDLTLEFVLYPDGDDWRIELEQLRVM